MTNDKILKGCLALFAFGLMTSSCSKMEDNHTKYIEQATHTYVGKVDSLKVHPGERRIKLSWIASPDPAAKRTVVYWNNNQDSATVTVVTGKKYAELLIDPLEEGVQTFKLVTYDNKGNKSLNVEKSGRAYGTNYIESLSNRVIKTVTSKVEGPILEWYPDASETIIGTKLLYLNKQNEDVETILLKKDVKIQLLDFKYGTGITYKTMFKPDSLSIDTFYSAPGMVKPTPI